MSAMFTLYHKRKKNQIKKDSILNIYSRYFNQGCRKPRFSAARLDGQSPQKGVNCGNVVAARGEVKRVKPLPNERAFPKSGKRIFMCLPLK
jgi:hypothetical protein